MNTWKSIRRQMAALGELIDEIDRLREGGRVDDAIDRAIEGLSRFPGSKDLLLLLGVALQLTDRRLEYSLGDIDEVLSTAATPSLPHFDSDEELTRYVWSIKSDRERAKSIVETAISRRRAATARLELVRLVILAEVASAEDVRRELVRLDSEYQGAVGYPQARARAIEELEP